MSSVRSTFTKLSERDEKLFRFANDFLLEYKIFNTTVLICFEDQKHVCIKTNAGSNNRISVLYNGNLELRYHLDLEWGCWVFFYLQHLTNCLILWLRDAISAPLSVLRALKTLGEALEELGKQCKAYFSKKKKEENEKSQT